MIRWFLIIRIKNVKYFKSKNQSRKKLFSYIKKYYFQTQKIHLFSNIKNRTILKHKKSSFKIFLFVNPIVFKSVFWFCRRKKNYLEITTRSFGGGIGSLLSNILNPLIFIFNSPTPLNSPTEPNNYKS